MALVLDLGFVGMMPALAAPDAAGPDSPVAAASVLSVSALKTDELVNPLGIDNHTPALSWKLTSSVNGQRQSAYRVRVASSSAALSGSSQGDIWDSGKVDSADSVGIVYGGPALTSQTRYYWTVQVWGANGDIASASEPSWWEMGLLNPADWQGADWITPRLDDSESWSDFVLDSDFTIKSGAASFLFRAQDSNNFYMWQVNSGLTPGKVLLRPHVNRNGNFAHVVPDIDVSQVIAPANANKQHHITIRAEGSVITTTIDGVLVSTVTDSTLTKGTIGFRVGDSVEHSLYDNVVVTGLAGQSLFADDFSTSPDPWFGSTKITDGQLDPGNGIVLIDPTPSAPILRTDFTLGKEVSEARAYVYGLGLYELHLNGDKVGDRVLTPASTPHATRNPYDTYDVTDLVKQGGNAVGIWLGDGYDSSYSSYAFRWLGPKQATMLIDVTYTDGTHQSVKTDNNWRWSTSPITSNGIYAGESYDARLEKAGWDTAGFDASSWLPVSGASAPGTGVVANAMEPIRVTQTITPVAMTEPKPGVFVYDLGQNIAGWSRLHAQGDSGTTITMRTAEEVGTDGMLDTFTNRAAAATDRFTLAGTGAVEEYEPRFTYHGFRYVEVTGFPGTPTIDSLEGRVVHADVVSTGSFDSSDSLLNQIWEMNRWGIINNSMSTPTDTPVRDERTPPGMDVQAYHSASTREFGMDRFYANYLLDMPAGTALPSDDAKSQYPDMAGDGVTLAWTLYEQYGDAATLATHFEAMKKFVDTNAASHPSYTWGNDGFGDWCPPDKSANANGGMGNPSAGDCTSEVPIVNTALWYLQAKDVALAATALGHPDEAAHYTEMATRVKNAFNATFLNSAGDTYGDGRQTTSVLPLALGMVPDDKIAAVGNQFVNRILTTDKGHLDTGIFGTRYLMDALAAVGRMDVAMTILGQTSYPSYGYEISKGATTPWEQWTYYSGMETHDHAMFAGINTSFYTQLAGILPATAGYQTITIDPQVPAGLQHVAASIDTVRGTVSSSWQQTEDGFALDVEVPVNSTATVHVPLQGFAHLSATDGAQLVSRDTTEAVYTVDSGLWKFASGTADQTISFDALPDKKTTDGDFTLSATASSGLPVSFGAAGSCTVASTTVHLTGAGDCTLTASQAGNAEYHPAAAVARTFAVKETPTPIVKSTVRFDSQGGSKVAAVRVDNGTVIKAPKSPTRTGYTFAGWYTKATGGSKWNFTAKVMSNATAYAHWTVQKRTVTFSSQGGSKVAAISTNYNTVIKAPKSPTRNGYTFKGWYTKATGGSRWNFTTKVTTSTTAYAHWTVQKRTVTFNAQGGSKVAAVSTNYNTAIKAPKSPTRTGYTFAGWYTKATGGSKWNFTTKVTANATAYAHWTKK
ncbi:alpha-L-rhamnosidase [Leifsonia kafniensis]|uniref:alpha-L-rhamnosidase n=1 Tax=Leifsonia kafniensis TaxID=475957 RepID=A0ABP7L0J6_9MICO